MCWNATVSLNTFAFALFAVALAYVNKYNDTPLAVYGMYLLFASMQLIEGGVWLTLNRADGAQWNRALSIVGFVVISLQPLVSLLTIRGRDALRAKLLLAYVAFLAVTCVYVLTVASTDFRTLPASNGHLDWKWLSPMFESSVGWCITLVWLTFLLLPWLLNRTYFSLAFILAAFVVSVVAFYKARTIGSMWCWIANLVFLKIVFDILFLQPCMSRLSWK